MEAENVNPTVPRKAAHVTNFSRVLSSASTHLFREENQMK